MIILCVPKYASLKVHALGDTFVSKAEDSAWSPANKNPSCGAAGFMGLKKDIFYFILFHFIFTSVRIRVHFKVAFYWKTDCFL